MPATRRRSTTLPFAQLNLRWNPFRTLDGAEAARIAVPAVEIPVRPLLRPGRAVQVTGRCGAGKTTHLHLLRHALEESVPRAPYLYFEADAPPPAIPDAPVLFLDELQRLPRRSRARLFRRRAASFVIASHRDHAAELRRAGIELLRAVELPAPSADDLRTRLNRRIAWARRGPGAIPRIAPAGAERLLARFGGDLHAIRDHLYERFQTLEAPCEIREV